MLLDLISALTSVNHLESRHSDTVRLSKKELESASPKMKSSSSRSKSGLRHSTPAEKEGFICGRTFYKESKIRIMTNLNCRRIPDSTVRSARNLFLRVFNRPKRFPGTASVFPNEKLEALSMLPLTKSHFPFLVSELTLYDGLTGGDYLVFEGYCRAVGVVRHKSRDKFMRCNPTPGITIIT
ncbi:hypothetical protein HI914_06372 [Erysiphe necator]|nr:hypothetical protein HI914_06372 [Erysiphe necator]